MLTTEPSENWGLVYLRPRRAHPQARSAAPRGGSVSATAHEGPRPPRRAGRKSHSQGSQPCCYRWPGEAHRVLGQSRGDCVAAHATVRQCASSSSGVSNRDGTDTPRRGRGVRGAGAQQHGLGRSYEESIAVHAAAGKCGAAGDDLSGRNHVNTTDRQRAARGPCAIQHALGRLGRLCDEHIAVRAAASQSATTDNTVPSQAAHRPGEAHRIVGRAREEPIDARSAAKSALSEFWA